MNKNLTEKDLLQLVSKKLEGKVLFPQQIKRAKEFLKNIKNKNIFK